MLRHSQGNPKLKVAQVCLFRGLICRVAFFKDRLFRLSNLSLIIFLFLVCFLGKEMGNSNETTERCDILFNSA
jgi:hypothetical protein